MSNTNIFITGSTGTIGKHLLKSLSESNFTNNIKLLVRDIEKARNEFSKLTNLAIEYISGDLDDIQSIPDSAFDNIERLFVLTLSGPDQPKVEGQLLAKVLSQSPNTLKQVIRLSALGASVDLESNNLFKYHGDSEKVIEKALLNTNVSYVILRPNLFMQNILRDDLPSIKQQSVFYKPKQDHGPAYQISHVDVRDIVDLTIHILNEAPEKHSGQTYNITGPQSLNYEQVAEIISNSIGKKVTWIGIDEFQFAESLKQFLPTIMVFALVRLFQMYKLNGSTANVHGDYQIVTGKKPRSLENFIEEHKHYF
ncbi:hypothetical protein ABK040_012984 [Willaertia magna]